MMFLMKILVLQITRLEEEEDDAGKNHGQFGKDEGDSDLDTLSPWPVSEPYGFCNDGAS